MKDETQRYSLEELASLTELPRRTVRYYIQEGLVPGPHGAGRGAYYATEHLERLLQIRKWQQAGLSLERIKELLAGEGDEAAIPPRPRYSGAVEVWSHIVLADGLEVTVEPGRAGLTPEQLRELVREVKGAYDRLRGEEKHR